MARDLSGLWLAGLAVVVLSACTVHHSRQAVWTPHHEPPGPESTFVTEEDSGLMLLGLLQLSEPDHYAVLLERARRRHACDEMHHAQLDFYTDHWLLVAFPIARMTLVCEKRAPRAAPPAPHSPAARASPTSTPEPPIALPALPPAVDDAGAGGKSEAP